jgi:hypothetical protein
MGQSFKWLVRATCTTVGLALSVTGFSLPSHAAATAVRVVTDPQIYEETAGGRAVVEDFTDNPHFPLLSCRLSSRTREQGLQAGDIEPGVVYKTHCSAPQDNELNIDFGSFDGAFLDGFNHGEQFARRALRVSFTEPVRAFGFDTNILMGRTCHVRVFHTDGRVEILSWLDVSAGFDDEQFYGFVSGNADISRVRIRGTNHTLGFALDDFRFNPEV